MNVPFLDLKSQYASLAPEIMPRIQKVCEQTAFIMGGEVSDFEAAFAAYTQTEYCVGLASGCDALLWGLKACGVKPGDEVITVANTFIATALAVTAVGAKLILVDCREDDYLMDLDAVEAAITPRTKALMPVHLYGQCVDMGRLMPLAEKHGLAVVEDAAQSHGATHHGRACGSFGDVGCFSFYPGKNLGAYGDAGAAVTRSKEHAEFIKFARNYGQSKKYHHDVLGWNCRMDTIQAAVLNVKLQYLNGWTAARNRVAAMYQERLSDLPLVLPSLAEGNTHVYHLYIARHPDRDAIMEYLSGEGITCGLHYPVPIHLQNCYEEVLSYGEGAFPIAEKLAKQIFSLPIFPEMTEEQVDYVSEKLKAYFQ